MKPELNTAFAGRMWANVVRSMFAGKNVVDLREALVDLLRFRTNPWPSHLR